MTGKKPQTGLPSYARFATDEDYEKRKDWLVGPLLRGSAASASPQEKPSEGDPFRNLGQSFADSLNKAVLEKHVSPSLPLLIEALAFAAEKHRNQRRKDAEASPYINHPIALARVLAVEAGVTDETVLAAAILHDTLEDTETTPAELLERFGEQVAEIVAEVTDDKTLPKQTRKDLQVEHAGQLSEQAKLVKLADKICNLRDVAKTPPADWPLERRQEYFDWAKRVVDRLRGAHAQLELLFDQAYAERP